MPPAPEILFLHKLIVVFTFQAALNRPAKRGAELASPPPRSNPASPIPLTPIKQEAAAAPFGDSDTAAGGGMSGVLEDMASSLTPERVDSWGIIKVWTLIEIEKLHIPLLSRLHIRNRGKLCFYQFGGPKIIDYGTDQDLDT